MTQRSLPGLVMVLSACAGPALVPVTVLDAGDAPPDAGATTRLVRLVYAMQAEPDERAAFEAVRASVPAARASVELSAALFVYGARGQALVQPFAPPDTLARRSFSPAALELTDGVAGPLQVEHGHAVVADLVVADFETLSSADRERVEYRVVFLTEGSLHAAACLQRASCQPADVAQVCCTQEVIGNSRRLRSIVELWSASRVTLQPVAIGAAAQRSMFERFLLSSLAREGGTTLIETTLAELPTALTNVTAHLAE